MVRLSLTLYQFLGYLIPGSVASFAIFFLGAEYFGLFSDELENASLVTVIVLLAVAYLVGFLIQSAFVGRIERWLFWFPERGEMPSRFLLHDANETHSRAFKSRISSLRRKFNLSCDGKLREQEYFELLYSRSIADGRGHLIENFNALYALSRGLTVAFLIATSIPITCLVHLYSIDDDRYGSTLPWLLLAAFLAAVVLCARRARSYGERFADEVYRVALTYEM